MCVAESQFEGLTVSRTLMPNIMKLSMPAESMTVEQAPWLSSNRKNMHSKKHNMPSISKKKKK
jgi:hypothetical protein